LVENSQIRRRAEWKRNRHRRVDLGLHRAGELTGTEDHTNVVFLHTTVEDGDHFQQILAWTLKSRWQEQNQLLREITETFRSEK
jgi:hypothetical protein